VRGRVETIPRSAPGRVIKSIGTYTSRYNKVPGTDCTTTFTQRLFWEGSTTVVYIVVWRIPVVWWGGGNTALWLVRKRVSLYVPSMNYQAMGSFSANHSAVFPPSHQTTGFRQTTV